jgi:hypothetical protein
MEAAGRTYPGFFIEINGLRLNSSNEKEHDPILKKLSIKFYYTVLSFDDNNLL